MKFEIEVPELMPADLQTLSVETQNFLLSIRIFFEFVCHNFKTADGCPVVSVFLRQSISTVYNVTKKESVGIHGNTSMLFANTDQRAGESDDKSEYADESCLPPVRVVMAPDKPGSWNVLRMSYPGTGYIELFSEDFHDGRAERVFKSMIAKLVPLAHTVPNLESKLQDALRILQ